MHKRLQRDDGDVAGRTQGADGLRCEELVGGSWAAGECGGEVDEIFVEEFEGEGVGCCGVEFGGEGVRPGSAETVGAYGWFAGHGFLLGAEEGSLEGGFSFVVGGGI